jgi:DNA-binding XRE family transcriptional regulator
MIILTNMMKLTKLMNRKRMDTEKTRKVVKLYRLERELTLRKMADELSFGLPEQNGGVSFQTISNWENGKHLPSKGILLALVMRTNDWRCDFAHDCLATMMPEFYQPATWIGRKALGMES